MANKNRTKMETHEEGIKHGACASIERSISTRSGPGKGIDLILDNGKTILVRAMNDELPVALTGGSKDLLKADYLMVVTNLRYTCIRRIYIIPMDVAKGLSANSPNKADGQNNWFIGPVEYQKHRDKFDILRE